MFPKIPFSMRKLRPGNKQGFLTDYTKSQEDIQRQLYSLCLYSFSSPWDRTALHSSILYTMMDNQKGFVTLQKHLKLCS